MNLHRQSTILIRTYQPRLVLAVYRDFTHSVKLSAGENKELLAPLERLGPPPFTVANITELLKGGVRQRGESFVLNDDSARKIRDAGGDAELLFVIAKAKK
jgi:hypothetical protein